MSLRNLISSILHWVELLIEVERWRQKRRACEESKNIKDKNKELPKAINSKTDINQKIDLFDKYLIPEANALIKEIKRLEENFDYDKISFTGGNNKVYGLDSFKTFEKLIKNIHSK